MKFNMQNSQANVQNQAEGVNLGKEVLVIEDNVEQEVTNKVEQFQLALRNSPEVMQIANSVKDVNPQTILEFGSKPATEISKFADRILHSINASTVEDSGVMIKELTKVMSKFEKNDFDDTPKGFLPKLFHNGKKKIDQLLQKYQTIGSEIDKIHTELVKYKEELNNTNKNLEEMYQQNFLFYENLEKYIAAGRMIVDHIKQNELPVYEERALSGNQKDIVEVDNWKNALEMFEQRIYDLEMAKMVALSTAPQIRLIQRGNYKLVSKIHSAFIITIPVFKNGIIQAVTLKRQRIMNDSLNQLDEKTNQLLIQNVQNTAQQSIEIARSTGTSSIKIETIQQNVDIIMNGMAETKAIEEENARLRLEGTKQIHALQEGLQQRMLNAPKQ